MSDIDQLVDRLEDNPPAFPTRFNFGDTYVECEGLTKREYFAAKAMQGICLEMPPEDAAAHAIRYADALIKALN
jgi:hypothetical protein